MTWNFHVAQRVVCVDGQTSTIIRRKRFFFGLFSRLIDAGSDLVQGRIYTVADVCVGASIHDGHKEVCLVVAEVEARHEGGCWPARCFRPLSEARLDQFRAHLAPEPKQRAEVSA